MLTKADGERIRQWNDGGSAFDATERLVKQSRAAAQEGMESYKTFFSGLTPGQKKALGETCHTENKRIAEESDIAAKQADEMADDPAKTSDSAPSKPATESTATEQSDAPRQYADFPDCPLEDGVPIVVDAISYISSGGSWRKVGDKSSKPKFGDKK